MRPESGAFPLVIAAPSGAGKTSLARELVRRYPDVVFSLSATTRPPRPGERHDVDYRFVDEAAFAQLVEEGELLEWAEVHGRRYGTLRRGVETALAHGRIVVLDIDVQGARMLRASLTDAVLVFVLPPSAGEMTRRLAGRGSGEGVEELQRRLNTARAELAAAHEFDYVIINDDFDYAMRTFESIMLAERSRIRRRDDIDELLAAIRAEIDDLS